MDKTPTDALTLHNGLEEVLTSQTISENTRHNIKFHTNHSKILFL